MTDQSRERMERENQEGESRLTQAERDRISDHQRLSAVTIFATIRREGEEELRRPAMSLWWSGIAAGLGLSTSVIAQGALLHSYKGLPYSGLIQDLGYTVGFVLVILSRLQLFTENTISVVLPVLADPNTDKLKRWARLWAIVLMANLLGTFVTAFIILRMGVVGPEATAGMLEVSTEFAGITGWDALARGIPAGFCLAAIVWMLPNSQGFEIFTIILFSWLISAGNFTHVVAGSTEIFLLSLHGSMDIRDGLLFNLLPALGGNIIGGTVLFALLAYGQIHTEI